MAIYQMITEGNIYRMPRLFKIITYNFSANIYVLNGLCNYSAPVMAHLNDSAQIWLRR